MASKRAFGTEKGFRAIFRRYPPAELRADLVADLSAEQAPVDKFLRPLHGGHLDGSYGADLRACGWFGALAPRIDSLAGLWHQCADRLCALGGSGDHSRHDQTVRRSHSAAKSLWPAATMAGIRPGCLPYL